MAIVGPRRRARCRHRRRHRRCRVPVEHFASPTARIVRLVARRARLQASCPIRRLLEASETSLTARSLVMAIVGPRRRARCRRRYQHNTIPHHVLASALQRSILTGVTARCGAVCFSNPIKHRVRHGFGHGPCLLDRAQLHVVQRASGFAARRGALVVGGHGAQVPAHRHVHQVRGHWRGCSLGPGGAEEGEANDHSRGGVSDHRERSNGGKYGTVFVYLYSA
mmetsp:Transcript_143255/g.457721  ORF Transcript_143255/g.457721 Transcript_143255/m.457721 type:complete len:223 (+) Transcript_143255:1-669(+)